MNDDADKKMERFEDLGRKLFQVQKTETDDEAEIIEDEQPEADE